MEPLNPFHAERPWKVVFLKKNKKQLQTKNKKQRYIAETERVAFVNGIEVEMILRIG